MPRIAGNDFPHIKDTDFYGQYGYQINEHASPTMRNCLLYKLSYHRFNEIDHGKGGGFDKVRNAHVVDNFLTRNKTSSSDTLKKLSLATIG